MRFAFIAFLSFAAMEFVSYLAHRYIYHGIGWVFHKSHHEPRKGVFEMNDIFPMTFASIAIAVFAYSFGDPTRSDVVATATGISSYGMMYFFIHDLYVHRRAKWMKLRIPFLLKLKRAHAIHHAYGGEPYGLLLFFKLDQLKNMKTQEDDVV
jgi:beta-carotene 3-hydroxylase